MDEGLRIEPAAREESRQAEITASLGHLQSPNPQERASAAKRLGELQAPAGPLLAALEDRNGRVRSAAATALGQADVQGQWSQVVDRLLAAIDDPNDYVVSAAIRSLGSLQASEARAQIVDCLEDGNPHVVRAAILALGRLQSSRDIPRLVPFLDSKSALLRAAAAQAMALLDYKPAVPRILSNLEADLGLELDRVTRLRVLRTHVESLATLQAMEAIPLLVDIVQHQVGLRSSATKALMAMDADVAVPAVAQMLADPGRSLRASVLSMVDEADYRAALPLVRPLLKDADESIKRRALRLVVKWDDLASAEQVRWMCHHDPHPYIRPLAATGLVRLVGERSLPDLELLASDSNALVRRSVARSLAAMEPLPPQGLDLLRRMAAEEPMAEVAEIVEAALSTHPPYRAPDVLASERTAHISLLPGALRDQSPGLLAALVQWQAALGDLVNSQNAQEIAEIDAALTVLILRLQEAQNREGFH